ncbi:hypothetical protein PLESTB_001195600 [Pleodorina starrii]|uniref:Uncharacterized protein n=1 Tax=Pleodorina starrii TaxID=330485 RepID=A0A9W6F5G3_9CHLO|nr:hypothetical protein PLESTM_001832900 [Pleodorina starrii]GLC57177.1 hypothetical protein PLESTB_001195600 [Pleodorina starrii]GLC71442.1 hypothetical protein PLESTF_001116300 [Pleodorina starrii]
MIILKSILLRDGQYASRALSLFHASPTGSLFSVLAAAHTHQHKNSSDNCSTLPCCVSPYWQGAPGAYRNDPSCTGVTRCQSTDAGAKAKRAHANRRAGQPPDSRTRADKSRPGVGRSWGAPTEWARQEHGKRKPDPRPPQPLKPAAVIGAARRPSNTNTDRIDPLQKWLTRVREEVKSAADKQVTAPAAAADAAAAGEGGASQAGRAPPDITAGEALAQLLPPPPPQPDGGLRPLGSQPLRNLGRGAASARRFDPALLPDVVCVFHRASQRLRFTTQLPQAVATYVATAAQRGTLDLASQDVSFCRALLLYLGHAQVVNRDCLEELRKALQPRWSALAAGELVEALVALGRLNDADRVAAHVGRPGPGASRLLRMLVDAEPCVTPLLEAQAQAWAARPEPQAGAAGAGAGLPPGAAAQLALVYLSFYRSATSGHQHFATSIMLQHSLEVALAALGDPAAAADPRVAAAAPSADELGRLVAGLAGVTLLRSHGLAPHLPRLVAAVMKRAAELSQPVRALLLDLPPQHWALPTQWRKTLLSAAASAGSGKRGAARKA